jgi:hypothetical protein
MSDPNEPVPPNRHGMAGPQPDDPDQADVDQAPEPDIDQDVP